MKHVRIDFKGILNGDPAFPTHQVQPSRDLTLSGPEWSRHTRPRKSLVLDALVAFLILLSTLTASASEWREALHKCRPAGIQEDIFCGKLLVPENWIQPDGRRITLNIEVIPSLDSQKSDRAFFDLAGGPGIPATGSAALYMDMLRDYRKGHDVVLVDQRGTGNSNSLHCPELESLAPLNTIYPIKLVRTCRESLQNKSDLTQYTTRNSARDLEEVRSALGFVKIDLIGLSYGTRLALEYTRLYPHRVRSVVLIGTAPAALKMPLYHAKNSEQALRLVFNECKADPSCEAAFPDLESEWSTLHSGLNEHPLYISTAGGGKEVEIRIEESGEVFRNLTYSTGTLRQMPFLIHSVASGNWEPFLKMLQLPQPFFTEGLYLSIVCAEDAVRITPAEVKVQTANTFLGDYRVRRQIDACKEWPLAKIPADFYEPVVSSIPVLLFTGSLDNVTPSLWADRVASSLNNSRHIIIKELGHLPEGLAHMECLDRMILQFQNTLTPHAVDTSCMDDMSPPPFKAAPEK
jgi:pimeloyl-ACP methyl ester carboxylesterase